jgi:diacylglycerol kinase (ATP)
LQIVAIGGVLHMGRLAVGLSRAQRLCQCSRVSITTLETLPVQVDGEPWMQPPATLTFGARSEALVLKRLPANSPAARMAGLVREALDAAVRAHTIDDGQRQALTAEIAAKLDHHWL